MIARRSRSSTTTLGALPDTATIGIENILGDLATAVVGAGDPSTVLEDDGTICLDFQGPSFDPITLGYDVTVDDGAPSGTYTNTLVHVTDDPFAQPVTITNALEVAVDCSRTITGRHTGALIVSSGVTCLDGATVIGAITVRPGAGLEADGSRVTGAITATGASLVALCGTTVTGPLRLTGNDSVTIGDPTIGCDPNRLTGAVTSVEHGRAERARRQHHRRRAELYGQRPTADEQGLPQRCARTHGPGSAPGSRGTVCSRAGCSSIWTIAGPPAAVEKPSRNHGTRSATRNLRSALAEISSVQGGPDHVEVCGDGKNRRSRSSTRARARAVGLIAVLSATSLVVSTNAGAQEDDPPDLTATPLQPDERVTGGKSPTSRLAETDPALLGRTDATPVRWWSSSTTTRSPPTRAASTARRDQPRGHRREARPARRRPSRRTRATSPSRRTPSSTQLAARRPRRRGRPAAAHRLRRRRR